jgi:Protein of unknown function (DUF2857)
MATTDPNSPETATHLSALSMSEALNQLRHPERASNEKNVSAVASVNIADQDSLLPPPLPSLEVPTSSKISGVRLELEIKDAKNLNDVCLRFLIQKGEQGELDKLLAQGMDADMFDRLRKMSIEDLNQLHSQQSLFSLVLNVDTAKQMLSGHDARAEDQKFLAYFIQRGATTEFLRRVLRVSDDKIQSYRRIYTAKRGRPPRPPELDVETIIGKWRTICIIEKRPRDRYFQLAEGFPQYSFATLASVVDEFENEEDQRRRRIA